MPIVEVVRNTLPTPLPALGQSPPGGRGTSAMLGVFTPQMSASTVEQVPGFPALRQLAVHLSPAHPWMTSPLVSHRPLEDAETLRE